MKKSILSLALLSFGAVAQVSPMANFEVSDIAQNMVPTVWENMKNNFVKGSECFNRAINWNYDLNKSLGLNSKKIIIHYTYKFNKELSAKWGFHIAPVLKVEGQDIVFDKGFVPWLHAPLTRQMWQEKFLIDGTKKLVKVAKELRQDLKDATRKLRKLDRSSSFYYEEARSIKKKIREIKQEMIEFHVTTAELEQQKPKKIEQYTRWIKFYEAELAKFEKGSRIHNSLKFQYNYAKTTLASIEKDLANAAHIQCEPIKNIEDLDFKQTTAWCYTQDVSMHYWGIPQLRLLNYGQYSRPYQSELPQKRRAGESYTKDSFDMEQIWLARKQAWGTKYKEVWKREYLEKEAAKDRVKNEKKRKRKAEKAARQRKKNNLELKEKDKKS